MSNVPDNTRPDQMSESQVVHWFDFICPFCYVSQNRDAFAVARGLEVLDLPFRAHPEIPPTGVHVGPRVGPMYRDIEAQARASGLALDWPFRIPNSGTALGAAEWVRRNYRTVAREFNSTLFEAHFVLNEDIGDKATVLRKAAQLGLDAGMLDQALADGRATAWVRESESIAEHHGVRGTPAWLYQGRLLTGAGSMEEFSRFIDAT